MLSVNFNYLTLLPNAAHHNGVRISIEVFEVECFGHLQDDVVHDECSMGIRN